MDKENDFLKETEGTEPKQEAQRENGENAEIQAEMPETSQEYIYDKIPMEKPKTITYAIISLLSGIISILCCWTGFGGLFFSLMAIAFFIVSKKHLCYCDFRSILGLIFGIFGILFSAILVYIILSPDSAASFQEYRDMLDTMAEAQA